MQLKYTTFFGESNFVNTVEEAKNIMLQGNKILFVNAKGEKIANNLFNSYREAQAFADSLKAENSARKIYINIVDQEVAETEAIDLKKKKKTLVTSNSD